MLGDKIKYLLEINAKGSNLDYQAEKELEQLQEAAKERDKLKEELKTQSVAFQEAFIKFDKESKENAKHIELGKALELWSKSEDCAKCFRVEIDPNGTLQDIMWRSFWLCKKLPGCKNRKPWR